MNLKPTLLLLLMTLLFLPSCKGGKESDKGFPQNFDKIGDAGRIDYLIAHAPADSVARFIIHTALGHNKDARIDTLAIATNYAYMKLQGAALDSFSVAYDALVESLPLGDKMKVYALSGAEDPQGLGYKLGLEYMSSIRNDSKSVAEVEQELEAFRKACGTDTATYRRFLIGFKTVLEVDHGKDVPEEIYKKYTTIDIQ